jgi:uncharacterized protein
MNTNQAMTHSLPIRKILVNLSQGFERHWFRGASGQTDAYRTQYLNAMSMSFPSGEQYFIDSVRAVADRLNDSPEHMRLKSLIKDFAAQEATHRQVHSLMNAQLEKHGLKNDWEPRTLARIARFAWMNPLHHLAMTAAYEHYTSVMSSMMLRHDSLTEGMSPTMRSLWRWHAMEETEHKAVAFDVYQAVSGHTGWRRRWFLFAMMAFAVDGTRQTLMNLSRDGTLFKLSTWTSAAQFFFGRPSRGGGWMWLCATPLLSYLRKDFHPNDHDSREDLARYARAHAQEWRLIR